jgi:hypothetical protein
MAITGVSGELPSEVALSEKRSQDGDWSIM